MISILHACVLLSLEVAIHIIATLMWRKLNLDEMGSFSQNPESG